MVSRPLVRLGSFYLTTSWSLAAVQVLLPRVEKAKQQNSPDEEYSMDLVTDLVKTAMDCRGMTPVLRVLSRPLTFNLNSIHRAANPKICRSFGSMLAPSTSTILRFGLQYPRFQLTFKRPSYASQSRL